jgi:hypothetical protein
VTAAAIGSLRCSAWARTVELDPGGTAGSYSGFLIIDQPLPWPRDVSEIEEISALSDLLSGSGLRVQAAVPGDDNGPRRVALYSSDRHGPFQQFAGREAHATDGADSLRHAVAGLLAGEGTPINARHEVLVCTHGRRDACCGSLGMELHSLLSSTSQPEGVRVARTSHTGGHRFAPTFIVLPEGTMWAFADLELVLQVLSREGDASVAANHYRGCAGLAGARLQAVEREVLRRTGWGLLSCPRTGSDSGDGGPVRLDIERPDGTLERWEASVVAGRTLPVPDCGRPIEEARKSETEWQVRELRRL